jgi:hypothetical protein
LSKRLWLSLRLKSPQKQLTYLAAMNSSQRMGLNHSHLLLLKPFQCQKCLAKWLQLVAFLQKLSNWPHNLRPDLLPRLRLQLEVVTSSNA